MGRKEIIQTFDCTKEFQISTNITMGASYIGKISINDQNFKVFHDKVICPMGPNINLISYNKNINLLMLTYYNGKTTILINGCIIFVILRVTKITLTYDKDALVYSKYIE